MRRFWQVWLAWLVVVPLLQGKALSNADAFALYGRTVHLMESTAVSVPELARAGAPVTENARQALITMRTMGRQNLELSYTFLMNLRAYLTLSDVIPKPSPFPEEAGKQFAELRDALNRAEDNFRSQLERTERERSDPDRDSLARYAEANSRLGPPRPDKPRVVFMGDSITDFWRLNEYFSGRDFINRGISGQITGQMLGRMRADVIDLKPAAMLVMAGTNDIARGMALTTIENNFTMMADLADAHHVKLLIASVLPVSDYHKDQNPAWEQTRRRPPENIRALNDWLRKFARDRGYTYVDYFPAMVDQAGQLQAELADDGLHPNGSGYRIMAPIALAAIDAAISAAPAKAKRHH